MYKINIHILKLTQQAIINVGSAGSPGFYKKFNELSFIKTGQEFRNIDILKNGNDLSLITLV